MISNYCMPER